MLGGLYGDLPQTKVKDDAGAPSQPEAWSIQLPPTRRPAAFSTAPQSVLKATVRSREGSQRQQAKPSPARPGELVDVKALPSTSRSQFSLGGNLVDEYDPAKPNDYEEVVAERHQQRQEAEREVERQEGLKREAEEQEQEAQRLAEAQVLQASTPDRGDTLNLSGEEAYLRRGRGGKASGFSDTQTGAQQSLTAAERMMQKMGWKEGQGLGRAGQGMATPLIAKSDGRAGAGVIVNADARRSAAAAAALANPEKRQRTGVAIKGAPTRVVLLRNMVGPGDVDDDLEDEVGNECSKYGSVQRVIIFEVTEPDYPEEQAVRIFIEFDRPEAATKALVDLEGRFFGGRAVRATFYDEGKFEREEVAPFPGED